MNKNNTMFSSTWDFKGYGTLKVPQRDWNQTLINRINQMSNLIYKSTFRGGANHILVPNNLKHLIETHDLFNDGSLAGRYKVIFDNTIDYDTIFVYFDNPMLKQNLYQKYINNDGVIHKIEIYARKNNEEEYQEYCKMHVGYITIKNCFFLGR